MSGPAPNSDQIAPARWPAGGDLALRVVSALALIPLALGAAYLGGWLFAVFWLAAAIGVAYEWAGLTKVPPAVLGLQAALMAGAVLLIMLGRPGFAMLALAAAVAGSSVLAAGSTRGWSAGGMGYAGILAVSPLLLRQDGGRGLAAIMFLFAIVWSTDIAAYFGGRLMGGAKLWPAVSPKKTWSGAFAGMAAAVAAGVAVGAAAGLPSLGAVALMSAVLSVASQAGDLFESGLKRRFGVKDSGRLIPGHGGLMDRLDGFVFAAAAALLIGLARGGFDGPARGLLVW